MKIWSGWAIIRWARFFPSVRLGRDVYWICWPPWSRCTIRRFNGKDGEGSAFFEIIQGIDGRGRKIVALKEARLIRHDDPRFGRLMQVIDSDARTALELAEQIRTHNAIRPI